MDFSNLGREEINASHWGSVHGPFMMEELICQKKNMMTSRGVFMNSNPLKYTMSILFVQMSVIILLSRLIFRILQPLKQGMISAQVLVHNFQMYFLFIALFFSFLAKNVLKHSLVLCIGWYYSRTLSLRT